MNAQQPHPDASATDANNPYAVLRLRDFRFFLLSSLCSVIAWRISDLAVGWELWRRTGDEMMLGWIGMVKFLPMLVFTLPAGQVADWFDRKRILLASQLSSALLAFGLALISATRGPIWMLFGCVLLRSIASAFGMTARAALLPRIITGGLFSKAVTWNSSFFELAQVVGPALGGFIIWHSWVAAYVCDGALLLLAAVMTSMIKPEPGGAATERASLDNLLAGLSFVYRTKRILAAMTLDMFAVLLGGATALLPIYADKILYVGETGLGWLRAAPALGAVCMALYLAHRRPMRHAGWALLTAVIGFGCATIVFGVSTWFPLSMAMLILLGALDNISVVVRHTMVQMLTPDSMRGRVSAVNGMFIGASNQLGEFESGAAAKLFSQSAFFCGWLGVAKAGAICSVVSGGIGTILVVLVVALLWPQIRSIGALENLKPDAEPSPTPPREPAAVSAQA